MFVSCIRVLNISVVSHVSVNNDAEQSEQTYVRLMTRSHFSASILQRNGRHTEYMQLGQMAFRSVTLSSIRFSTEIKPKDFILFL